MSTSREALAKRLFSALEKTFKNASIKISVKRRVVDWHCCTQQGKRKCIIQCYGSTEKPEYYCNFMIEDKTVAISRTGMMDATIAAVQDWLNGLPLSHLYDHYAFVDNRKRQMIQARDAVYQEYPNLQDSVLTEQHHLIGDAFNLEFKRGDRSCLLEAYGDNPWLDAACSWDGSVLFQFRVTCFDRLGAVLQAWLHDRSMPSVMRKAFPWLEIDELADFFEKGKPVMGEFLMSWRSVDTFFDDNKWDITPRVKLLLKGMRALGYDQHLRAGQAMTNLILSRTRYPDLYEDDFRILFFFRSDGLDIYHNLDGEDGGPQLQFADICLAPEIIALLNKLKEKPVRQRSSPSSH